MMGLSGFLPAARYEHAGLWMILGFFLLLARFVKFSTIETREALLHGLLRPLSSNLRIEATSEVVGRLLQPQRQPKRLFQA